MNIHTLVSDHWDIFLSHVCEFHPLSKPFIITHQDRLDWESLSKNKTIAWDMDFIRIYEKRWHWYYLSKNDAIQWDNDNVLLFKDHLDWFHLNQIHGPARSERTASFADAQKLPIVFYSCARENYATT